jgi:hypothetical protein
LFPVPIRFKAMSDLQDEGPTRTRLCQRNRQEHQCVRRRVGVPDYWGEIRCSKPTGTVKILDDVDQGATWYRSMSRQPDSVLMDISSNLARFPTKRTHRARPQLTKNGDQTDNTNTPRRSSGLSRKFASLHRVRTEISSSCVSVYILSPFIFSFFWTNSQKQQKRKSAST